MTTSAVKIKKLSKSYNGSEALSDIDITILDGQFFGLLGPNGAGKSTTINILTGLVRKDSGNIAVFGKDIEKGAKVVGKDIEKGTEVVLDDATYGASTSIDHIGHGIHV